MLELVKAGGWPMIPLLLLTVVALGIILERFWSLRRKTVLPPGLGAEVRAWAARGNLDPTHIDSLRRTSPLGALLAAALDVRHRPRDQIRERIEDVGRHLVHRMERFLNGLGTIAAAGPLLGLFGTVVGMIQMFLGILDQRHRRRQPAGRRHRQGAGVHGGGHGRGDPGTRCSIVISAVASPPASSTWNTRRSNCSTPSIPGRCLRRRRPAHVASHRRRSWIDRADMARLIVALLLSILIAYPVGSAMVRSLRNGRLAHSDTRASVDRTRAPLRFWAADDVLRVAAGPVRLVRGVRRTACVLRMSGERATTEFPEI